MTGRNSSTHYIIDIHGLKLNSAQTTLIFKTIFNKASEQVLRTKTVHVLELANLKILNITFSEHICGVNPVGQSTSYKS